MHNIKKYYKIILRTSTTRQDPSLDSRVYAKQLLKRGCHLLNAGENQRALNSFVHALGITTDYGDATTAAYYLPRIRHCLALAHAALGNTSAARKNFEQSLKRFEADNHIGRARTMRDFGWFLVANGQMKAGRTRLQGALDTLALESNRDERWTREQAATEGFLARLDAKTNPRKAAAKLRSVDVVLQGSDKWMYELDNLQHLIPLLGFVESLEYRTRAFVLRERIRLSEDAKVLIDDIAMGRPVHGIARLMVRSTRRHLPI